MPQKARARSGKPQQLQSAASSDEPSRELKSVYEDVIAHECAPGLAPMYRRLPEESKKKLLQALKESVRHHILHASMREAVKETENIIPPFMEQFFMSSSLAKALQLERKGREPVSAMEVARVQGFLQTQECNVATCTDDKAARWGRGMTTSKDELQVFVKRRNAEQAKDTAQNLHHVMQTSKGVTKPESQRRHNLANYKPVTISDLKLFEVAKGCSLSGVLVTEPLSMVAVMVHVEDANCDIVPVALYNQIPGGKPAMEAADYVRRTFPQGSKVTIIEPFYKIAADGQRVLRVDDAADFILTIPSKGVSEDGGRQADLPETIEQSRKLLKEGNAAMAMDTILKALQTPDAGVEDIVKVLGNRSQAQLRAGHSAAALRDSATVLLLRPCNSKAWQRYHAALQSLQMERTADRARTVMDSRTRAEDGDTSVTAAQGGSGFPSAKERPSLLETHQVLEKCLNLWPTVHGGTASSGTSSEDLKSRGDTLFRNGDFAGATSKYSQALASAPCMIDVARACVQLARCTLECNGYHTALAAAAAAVWIVLPAAQLHVRFEKPLGVFLRLQFKALFSLGITADVDSPHISNECPQSPQSCGAWLLQSLEEGKSKSNVPCIARANVDIAKSSKVPGLVWVDESSRAQTVPAVELVDGLEHREVPGKGRGIFATKRFTANDIILSIRPLAVAAKESFHLVSFTDSVMTGASQLSFLAARDAKVALALSHLDHIEHFRSESGQKSSRASRKKAAKKKSSPPVANPDSTCSEEASGSQQQCETADESAGNNKLPLVHHLPDMLQTLSSLVLPLLPQLWEYFPASEHPQLSSERISSVVSVNCFGHHDDSVRSFEEKISSGSTLHTVISLLNHSDQPNAQFLKARNEHDCTKSTDYGLKMLRATREIRPGDELTLCYTRDQEVLQKKWGIRPAS